MSTNTSRLVWELRVAQSDLSVTEVIPREQKSSKDGRWTGGRPISLRRLYEQASQLNFITPADLRVTQQIRPIPWPRNQFELRAMDALHQLAGHPLVDTGLNPLDVTTLKGLIARARVLLTNDTGPRHMAIALGLPATQMPAFGDRLDVASIEAIVAHIYSPPAQAPR